MKNNDYEFNNEYPQIPENIQIRPYQEEAIKKWFKRFVIGTVISLILIIVIPSKETCYQMLAAKMVTYENVELAVEKIEEIALFFMNGAK